MKNKSLYWFSFITILLIAFAVVFEYQKAPLTFFQQDEWAGFGGIIYQSATGGLGRILVYPAVIGRGHFFPFTFYQLYTELKFFGMHFAPYAYISIATHVINSFLVFVLGYHLLKKKSLALFSSLLFAVSSIATQAVEWIAASPATQGSVLFFLLSLIFIVRFFGDKKAKNYYFSLIFFSIGVLYKESVLFYFALLPVLWFFFEKKITKEHFLKFIKPLAILVLLYLGIRASLFLIPVSSQAHTSATVNLAIGADLGRMLVLPFKILPQALIPAQYLIGLSDWTIIHFYPQYVLRDGSANPFVAQTFMFDRVGYALSFLFFVFFYLLYRFLKKREDQAARGLIASLLIIILSALPFAFIPQGAADFSIFEPRDLYIAVIGGSILTSIVIYSLFLICKASVKTAIVLTSLCLLPVLFLHVKSTREQIYMILNMSQTRTYILNEVTKQYPTFSMKTVFLIESSQAYYGITEKIPPFQSGFGQTLLVWYYFHGNPLPVCFYAGNWLYDIEAQGYRDCSGKGYGYFRDYNDLKKALVANNIPVANVVAFSWDGQANRLINTTKLIQSRLKKN